jgi:hypothetical protein
MVVSKTHRHKAASDAINAYVGKAEHKPASTKTGKAKKVAKTEKVTTDKIQGKPTVNPQVIGDKTEGVLDRPIRMRYGFRPPMPDTDADKPIKMKYGIMPQPPVDDNDAPIRMKYGIRPRPRD